MKEWWMKDIINEKDFKWKRLYLKQIEEEEEMKGNERDYL
jgi:hypothetical protein